jgi:DNA modification methylase
VKRAELSHLAHRLSQYPIDRDFLPQDRLDIRSRERTSRYPWRGQFSPELVDLLLDTYAGESSVILDPFSGSGTTLFESVGRGLECSGAEINPAAVQFSRMAVFANLDAHTRTEVINKSECLLQHYLGEYFLETLFRRRPVSTPKLPLEQAVWAMLEEAGEGPVFDLLATSIMLAMGDGEGIGDSALEEAFVRNCALILDLAFSTRPCEVFMADARALPLSESSVDLVITSPPYINVFNYHQNYRKAMEIMRWDLLDIARSEIGSNRKHRGNRFLTVIQFCMDMAQALTELRRVLRSRATVVLVVGRESSVRGVAFNNGHLLALLAITACGFTIERWQERKFVSRFGATIFEDLLTLRLADHIAEAPEELGRQVGVLALETALSRASTGDVRADIASAIAHSPDIMPSGLLAQCDKRKPERGQVTSGALGRR